MLAEHSQSGWGRGHSERRDIFSDYQVPHFVARALSSALMILVARGLVNSCGFHTWAVGLVHVKALIVKDFCSKV